MKLLNFAIAFILKAKLNDRYITFVFGSFLTCFWVVFRIYLLCGVKIWRFKKSKSKALLLQIKNIAFLTLCQISTLNEYISIKLSKKRTNWNHITISTIRRGLIFAEYMVQRPRNTCIFWSKNHSVIRVKMVIQGLKKISL